MICLQIHFKKLMTLGKKIECKRCLSLSTLIDLYKWKALIKWFLQKRNTIVLKYVVICVLPEPFVSPVVQRQWAQRTSAALFGHFFSSAIPSVLPLLPIHARGASLGDAWRWRGNLRPLRRFPLAIALFFLSSPMFFCPLRQTTFFCPRRHSSPTFGAPTPLFSTISWRSK